MKSTALIISCILLSYTAFSQSNSTDSIKYSGTFKHEIGLNVTSILSKFLSLSGEDNFQGPYLLTYKKKTGINTYFRSGVGLNFFSTIEDEDEDNPTPQFNNNFVRTDLRFGVEKHLNISRKWLFTYGIDFPLAFTRQVSTSISPFQEVKLTNNTFGIGVGPVVGIHFSINDKIRIGTEATFYVSYTRIHSKRENDGMEDDADTRQRFSGNTSSPAILYLGITI